MKYIYIHTHIRLYANTFFLQEQFFIMKPKEEIIRSFKLYAATDQAANYVCAGKTNSD